MPRSSKKMVGLGPVVVETYPSDAWTKMDKIRMEDVWEICGPTVDKNILNHPLWKVFAIVYLEGLLHGAAITEERGGKSNNK